MKKKILKLVLATSVLTAVVSVATVSAAAVTTKAPAFTKTALNFNGKNADLRTVEVNKVKLVALRDLVDVLGASLESDNGTITLQLQNTLELKEKVSAYTVNGATMAYTAAPVNVGGTLFVELDTTVDGLGGSVDTASGATTYRSFKLLEGDFSTPYWISGNKIIAVKDGDTKSIYKVNPTDMSYELYSDNEDALSLIVSPDGNYGVYTNTDAQIKLITLNPGITGTLSVDKSLKTDFTWSADSKKIYFAQGDNQEKISYIDVATGAIKTVLEDKINYKSDLHLSADGTKLLYNLNLLGTSPSTFKAASGPEDLAASEDTLALDFNVAGSQLFMLDLVTAGAKPVKLTDGKANTYDSTVLNDGSAVYVNVDPADDASKGSLKLVSAAGVIKDLVADLDVTSSVATASGSFIITGLNAAGKTVVATVTADGKKTDVVTSDADVVDISSSTDGATIFATIDGKLAVINNGTITYLTK
ncbi:hypothetical protein EHS13_34085 [Paenibacillus psychroresistens]|uniref:Copper amine oxidase-like N-terminal domain-containing protein n=1 Tax=Paenibacillus psychroresistens TaxID=1778678 RepID=A0A6B8RUV8_9BACL|nr:hypothetical protein [Paenibacillus psychroresistens]QGQ99534.1 hypothetical protein EHS13_34085 [Paenibacillus psychroresistens]